MAIQIKKYCKICGAELPDLEEVVYTCTAGIIEVRDRDSCKEHAPGKPELTDNQTTK